MGKRERLTASCHLSGLFQRVFVSLDILRVGIRISCRNLGIFP